MFAMNKLRITRNRPQPTRLANFRQQWYRKWNRVCATVVCVLGFSLLLGIVIQGARDGKCAAGKKRTAPPYRMTVPAAGCSRTEGCDVTCKDVRAAELRALIETLFVSDPEACRQMGTLNLVRVHFADGTLGRHSLRLERQMSGLNLHDSDVELVAEGAFRRVQFARLAHLTFQGARLRSLSAGSLAGLDDLVTLCIRDNRYRDVALEAGALASMSALATLQLEDTIVSGHVVNLTASPLPGLRSAVFRNGPLLTRLPAGALRAPDLETLDVSRNSLTVIEEGAFDAVRRLRILDLKDNRLATLSERALLHLPTTARLYLRGNPWHCECSLAWIRRANVADATDVVCATPSGMDFAKLHLCAVARGRAVGSCWLPSPSSTPLTTPQTTSSESPGTKVDPTTTNVTAVTTAMTTTTAGSPRPTASTTTMNPDVVVSRCNGCDGRRPQRVIKFNGTMLVQASQGEEDDADGGDGLRIVVAGISMHPAVMWFDSEELRPRCVATVNRRVTLSDVKPGRSYVVCGVDGGTSSSAATDETGDDVVVVSALDCRAIFTRPPPEDRVWLLQRHVKPVALGVTFLALGAAIAAAVAVYCFLRRHPALLAPRRPADTTSVPVYFKRVVRTVAASVAAAVTYPRRPNADYLTPVPTISGQMQAPASNSTAAAAATTTTTTTKLSAATAEENFDSFRSEAAASYVPTDEVVATWRVYTKSRTPMAQLFASGAAPSAPRAPTPPLPPPRHRDTYDEPV